MDLIPRRTFVSLDRHTTVTAEPLVETFMIGPQRAKASLRATTQRGTRSTILPIGRRYRADCMYNFPRLHTKFASHILWVNKKSLRSNVASQIYSHKCGSNVLYPLQRANGEQEGNSLNDFIHEFGLPDHLQFAT